MEGPVLTDAQIVARCRTGDEAAWRELVERMSRYVYAICTRGHGFSPEEADDAFQDVFTRAYRSLHTLRDDEALRPWLGQLTRRICIDRIRARRQDVAPLDEVPEVADTDRILERIEEAMDVRLAMQGLPEHCNEILDRFFARDQSYREIGEVLSIPAGTIASRISRCLAKLREILT